MKKILLMTLLLTMFLGMHAQTGMRMLITYFSWSGRTKNLAEELQRQPDADIYRIEQLVSYTDDYQELAYQISNKEKEENARPALKDTLFTLNDIANATPDSEHLDGLGTRGSQSRYAQEVNSWRDCHKASGHKRHIVQQDLFCHRNGFRRSWHCNTERKADKYDFQVIAIYEHD